MNGFHPEGRKRSPKSPDFGANVRRRWTPIFILDTESQRHREQKNPVLCHPEGTFFSDRRVSLLHLEFGIRVFNRGAR